MVIYRLILSVLTEKIRGEYPGFLHPWYSDEFIMEVDGTYLKPAISFIEAMGISQGLFIEPDKSQFV